MWWKGLLPESTPESRLDLVAEYQRTLALPPYVNTNEMGFTGPMPYSTMDKINSLSRVYFSCFTILSLSKQKTYEGKRPALPC